MILKDENILEWAQFVVNNRNGTIVVAGIPKKKGVASWI